MDKHSELGVAVPLARREALGGNRLREGDEDEEGMENFGSSPFGQSGGRFEPLTSPPGVRMRYAIALITIATAASAQTTAPARPRPRPRPLPQYTIEQFMNTTVMFGASFSSDDKSILVTSDQSGVFNAYAIPAAGGTPVPLTHSTTDGIFTIGYLPHDRRVLYSQGRGGNENDHIYLLDTTGTARDLTPGDSLKASFIDWAAGDTSFYFVTNGRDRRYFDVYEMPLASLTPRLIFQDTVGYNGALPSYDGRWMALQRTITTSSSNLYVRNMQTGEIREVDPHQNDVQLSPQAFSRDSRYLYYTTDEGSEFGWLARYDVTTGTRDVVERPDWDVVFAYPSKRGTYLVIGVNVDAHTEIRLYEAATHRPIALPRVPAGEISGVEISPDERTMALYINGSRAPSNLYVLDLGTHALKQLTQNLSPEIDAANLVDAQVVRFASYDGLKIPSLLYRPKQATKAPAVLWIHGGPGGQSRVGYSAFLQYLTNHGYVVLAVNNRGSGGYGKSFDKQDDKRHGEADLDDIVWAKRYLAGLGYVDTNRVAIAGGSYGGYLTLAGVTFRPQAFAAGVDFFGISNWVRTLRSVPAWWEAFRKALYDELGDPNSADSVRLYRISPLFHADQIVKPLLVLQGANDPRVLKVESDQIVDAVHKRGGVAEYVVFPDEGHGFIKKENNIKAYRTALEFLDRYVKKTGT
jgi:dipeptidyl aminopeptidase/acylaminoacyl peptidase